MDAQSGRQHRPSNAAPRSGPPPIPPRPPALAARPPLPSPSSATTYAPSTSSAPSAEPVATRLAGHAGQQHVNPAGLPSGNRRQHAQSSGACVVVSNGTNIGAGSFIHPNGPVTPGQPSQWGPSMLQPISDHRVNAGAHLAANHPPKSAPHQHDPNQQWHGMHGGPPAVPVQGIHPARPHHQQPPHFFHPLPPNVQQQQAAPPSNPQHQQFVPGYYGPPPFAPYPPPPLLQYHPHPLPPHPYPPFPQHSQDASTQYQQFPPLQVPPQTLPHAPVFAPVPPQPRMPTPPPSRPPARTLEQYWAEQLMEYGRKAKTWSFSQEDVFKLDTMLFALQQVDELLTCETIQASDLDCSLSYFVAVSKPPRPAEAQGTADSAESAGELLEGWWARFGGSAAASRHDITEATLRSRPPGMKNGAEMYARYNGPPVPTAAPATSSSSSCTNDPPSVSARPSEAARNDGNTERGRSEESAPPNPGSTSTSTSALPTTPADGHHLTLGREDLGGDESVHATEDDSRRKKNAIQTEAKQSKIDVNARPTTRAVSKKAAISAAPSVEPIPGPSTKPSKPATSSLVASTSSTSAIVQPSANTETESINYNIRDCQRGLSRLAARTNWNLLRDAEIEIFGGWITKTVRLRDTVVFDDMLETNILKSLKTIVMTKDPPTRTAALVKEARELYSAWTKRFEKELRTENASALTAIEGRANGVPSSRKRKRVDKPEAVEKLTVKEAINLSALIFVHLQPRTQIQVSEETLSRIDGLFSRLETLSGSDSLKLAQGPLEKRMKALAKKEEDEAVNTKFKFAQRAAKLEEVWDAVRRKK